MIKQRVKEHYRELVLQNTTTIDSYVDWCVDIIVNRFGDHIDRLGTLVRLFEFFFSHVASGKNIFSVILKT